MANPFASLAYVLLNGVPITCAVARTASEQSEGLQRIDALRHGQGMLFPLGSTRRTAFAMKEVPYAIDIVMVRDGAVSKVHHACPPGSRETYEGIASHVIEVPAGFCRTYGIDTGAEVIVDKNGLGSIFTREAKAFHGTPAQFVLLDHNKSGLGTHFGTFTAAIDRLKKRNRGTFYKSNDARILLYDLDIKKPLVLPDLGTWDSSTVVAREIFAVLRTTLSRDWGAMRKAIEDAGYDAVAYKNEVEDRGGWSYIVWNDKLIKPEGETTVGNLVESQDTSGVYRFGPLAKERIPGPKDFDDREKTLLQNIRKELDFLNSVHDRNSMEFNERQLSLAIDGLYRRLDAKPVVTFDVIGRIISVIKALEQSSDPGSQDFANLFRQFEQELDRLHKRGSGEVRRTEHTREQPRELLNVQPNTHIANIRICADIVGNNPSKDFMPHIEYHNQMVPDVPYTDVDKYLKKTIVSVDKLIAGQAEVYDTNFAGAMKGLAAGDLPILIPQPNGKYLIYDGHHRIVNQIKNHKADRVYAQIYQGPTRLWKEMSPDYTGPWEANKHASVHVAENEGYSGEGPQSIERVSPGSENTGVPSDERFRHHDLPDVANPNADDGAMPHWDQQLGYDMTYPEYDAGEGDFVRSGNKVPATSSQIRTVEPLALTRDNDSGVDTFASGEQFIFVGSDGLFYTVRSKSNGQRYVTLPSIFEKAFAVLGQRPTLRKGKPVPADLRGIRRGNIGGDSSSRQLAGSQDVSANRITRVALPRYREEGVELPDVWKQIEKYVGQPDVFFTMTSVAKVGINPQSGYETPIGIYSYPLDENHFKQLKSNRLPFAGQNPYINVFRADLSRVHDVTDPFTEQQYQEAIAKIAPKSGRQEAKAPIIQAANELYRTALEGYRQMMSKHPDPKAVEQAALAVTAGLGRDVALLTSYLQKENYDQVSSEISASIGDIEDAIFNVLDHVKTPEFKSAGKKFKQAVSKYVALPSAEGLEATVQDAADESNLQTPFGRLWNVTRVLAGGSSKWAAMLRQLGFEGVTDVKNCTGLIHPSEPCQAVFFSTAPINVIGRWDNPFDQKKADQLQNKSWESFKRAIERGDERLALKLREKYGFGIPVIIVFANPGLVKKLWPEAFNQIMEKVNHYPLRDMAVPGFMNIIPFLSPDAVTSLVRDLDADLFEAHNEEWGTIGNENVARSRRLVEALHEAFPENPKVVALVKRITDLDAKREESRNNLDIVPTGRYFHFLNLRDLGVPKEFWPDIRAARTQVDAANLLPHLPKDVSKALMKGFQERLASKHRAQTDGPVTETGNEPVNDQDEDQNVVNHTEHGADPFGASIEDKGEFAAKMLDAIKDSVNGLPFQPDELNGGQTESAPITPEQIREWVTPHLESLPEEEQESLLEAAESTDGMEVLGDALVVSGIVHDVKWAPDGSAMFVFRFI